MPLNKTEAIVLHARKQGETSKILSLYTLHHGRQSVMAKGARSLKSRYSGVLEPLTHIQMVFYHYENRDLHYLSQAEAVHPFPRIHGELGRMALASIPCEICERNEAVGHANPALFSLLLESLLLLDTAENGQRQIVRAFMLHYLDLSGFRGEYRLCLGCREEKLRDRQFFDYSSGGYRCSACEGMAGEGQPISKRALQALHYLGHARLDQSINLRSDPELGRELDQFLLANLRWHLEPLRLLRSIAYLEQLQSHLQQTQEEEQGKTYGQPDPQYPG
ncbi:MAG TPA: DNA repair protein RecO [bacterium]|nr:DNA repair protein RecO [bacterium]HQG44238.1 DNA repair protein RecO [bacterium]HQI47614.1 DNA repair protein RecO [bacterium]HQJ63607.1 DNA repair protein RecO [bacterium]